MFRGHNGRYEYCMAVLSYSPVEPSWFDPACDAARHRVVVVAVGTDDRRTLEALGYASRIAARRVVAVHVVDHDDRALIAAHRAQLADELGVPLIVMHPCGTVPETIAYAVECEHALGAHEVIVVGAQMRRPARWHLSRILHDRTAAQIVERVERIPKTAAVLLTVDLEP